jgi:uncharacterized protein YukJ
VDAPRRRGLSEVVVMALDRYGVLVGRAVDRRREGGTDSPHYQVRMTVGAQSYRVAVNAKSQQPPSDLLYLVDDDLRHPVTGVLGALPPGWHDLASGPGTGALDFVRGNLFDPGRMRTLPPDAGGPDNDLADLLDHYAQRAVADPGAVLYACGQRWGPEPAKDKIFRFAPGNGVHDIHMNQGNSPRFRRDDGVWQDGGLLLHLPGESRWVGIFLAFQSQAWHTDDVTGHALGGGPQLGSDPVLRIIAALVNPPGPAPETERVLLLNASPAPIELAGWRLADANGVSLALPAGTLPAGEVLAVTVADGVQLGNRGGAITLLDGAGLKVHGVSYTADQARREGWTLAF